MTPNSISERLKKKLEEINNSEEKNEKESLPSIIEEKENDLLTPIKNIYSDKELEYIDDIIEEEDLRIFLKEKTKKMLIQEHFTVIFVGTILEEVFQKIGNHKNGTYQKWLFSTGINERTALRYRNRANLFKKAISDNAKKVILKLSHEDIQRILEDKKLEEEALIYLESDATKEDIKELLKSYLPINIEIEKEKFEKEINFNNISNEISNKWENLDYKKKKKVGELVGKIKKIINS